jgi:hypothetical protein
MRGLLTDRESLFEGLRRFHAAWVSHGWSWDRRFECVASTFDVTLSEEARRAFTGLLDRSWTKATLRRAPPLVQEVAEATGGVRSDQTLYASPEVDGIVAYGLWWPWGGEGSNISMRVGLTGQASFNDVLDLREIFGALDD